MSGGATLSTGPSRARHIVDTMSDSPLPEMSLPEAPRLAHAVPVSRPVDQAPLPIPTSTFSSYVPFRPKCGHITMARIYHVGFRCERCNRHGQFGWLYRCTEHRELILDDMKRHGFKVSLARPTGKYSVEKGYDIDNGVEVAFDKIGAEFAEQMSLGKWGPDKRQDQYSVLHEMTQEQMQSYTPDQIATLLAQRENVRKTAEQEMRSPQYNRGRALFRHSFGPNPLVPSRDLFETVPVEESTDSPWVPTLQQECRFKACHHCYRRAAEKAWLSLDGIVNGDIPPTAAGAYSFHYMQQRPVCDALVVSNLGCRAVPMPRPPRPIIDLTHSDDEPQMHILQYSPNQGSPDGGSDSDWTTTDDDSSEYSDSDFDEDAEELRQAIPLPRTALRRSAPHSKLRAYLESSGTGLASRQEHTTVKTEHVEDTGTVDTMPCLPDDFYDPAVYLPTQTIAGKASQIPLPGPTFDEELFFTDEIMGELQAVEQEEGHHFGSDPPHVPGGIALREEAEEAGMADIVAQV